MARVIHKSARDQILADAGLTPADGVLFPLAIKVAKHIKAKGMDGFDITDPADRAALIAEVGESDVNKLTKALAIAKAAGEVVEV
jgi:hypothetical protein